MPRAYQGSFITTTPITPSGPYQCSTASGVWTIEQMVGWQNAGLWPTAGNAYGTVGIFALGYTTVASTTRNKYTFSSCVNATATAASAASQAGSAAGNVTVGIFALGNCTTTRNKYTYSGDVNASATASSATSQNSSAAGNSTVGIFALGYLSGTGATTTRNKYTYSGCVNATATASSAASQSGSAASNGTCGVNM